MDGKEYFDHYRHTPDSPFHPNDSLHAQALSASLARKLFHLYGEGEIHELTEKGKISNSQKLSTNTLDEYRALQKITGSLLPYYESMDHIDPSDKSIDQQRLEISTQLSSVSDCVLSSCVTSIAKISNPNQLSPSGIGKRIRDAIGRHKDETVTSLKDWRISLSEFHHNYRSINIDHFFTTNNLLAARKLSVDQNTRLDEDNDDVLRAISVLHEIELFLALNHWVKERGLPYLPVFAPIQLEAGRLANGNDNPHADMLLCCMMPNQNDIIPIQVKKGRRQGDIERYIDGMVIWTNQDTYPVLLDRFTGAVNGRQHTIERSSCTYGKILEGYYQINTEKKQKRMSKAKRTEYLEPIEYIMAKLDRRFSYNPDSGLLTPRAI
jgi:hypothetical protein